MKIGDMLRAVALRNPGRTAVVCGEQSTTFAALEETANRIANGLIGRGLAIGDRVVMYLPNSIGLVEGFAGIAKAGGVTVPVNTRLTAAELAFVAGDCRPFALLHAPRHADIVREALIAAPDTLAITVGGNALPGGITLAELKAAGAWTPPPSLPVKPDDLQIGYTSGATGPPKGAVLTHANQILGHLCAVAMFGIDRDDVILATSPLSHRTGIGRMVNCFCLGTTLISPPSFDAAETVRQIAAYGVTGLSVVPTVARMLVDHLERTDDSFPTLRFMLAGGESFPLEVKQRLARRLPGMKLHVYYGLTEAGIVSSLDPADQFTRPDSAGRPWPGIEVRLAAADGVPAPDGEAGEILVRAGEPGSGLVMREYFADPEATREAFADGWFRTGDIGRFDADGFLYVVDRVKDMILSGGFNIYSREVEHAILAQEGVADVAVCAVPDDRFGEAVAAFVVPEAGAVLSADTIIANCREVIAGYKKPKYVFFTDALPRNAVGKLVKAELRQRAAALAAG